MLKSILAAGLAAALLGGTGAAAGARDETIVCLRHGERLAPVCNRTSSWGEDDFCVCPSASIRTKASWCADGQKPPVESAALVRARRAAAEDGSLIGDTFEGRPMCVRRPPRPR